MAWTWVRPDDPTLLHHRPLLDIGVGDGQTAAALAPGAIGLDARIDALRAARRTVWPLVAGRASAIPFRDARFATVLAADLFHHSAVDLGRADAVLVRVFVTPRMHGVHHGHRPEQTHANWGVVFSWWDRLHGTFRYEAVPPPIGLPDGPAAVDPVTALALPWSEAVRRS